MEIVSQDNAEQYTWGTVCDGWHLLKSGGLSVIQERVPPGAAEVLHYHEKAHQFFFVLSGEATMETEQERLVLRSHQGLSVPPGVHHRLRNEGAEVLSFLVISSPMAHGDRVLVGSAARPAASS